MIKTDKNTIETVRVSLLGLLLTYRKSSVYQKETMLGKTSSESFELSRNRLKS